MERQKRTIETERAAGNSMLLPGLVLALVVGLALWFQFGADAGNEPAPIAAQPTLPEPPVMPEAPALPEQPAVPAEQPPAESVEVDPQSLVPPGRTGLVEALRRGEIRTGSRADVERWANAARASGLQVDTSRMGLEMTDILVIQRDFVVPGRLHGAHSVVFVLDPGVPFPRGDLGHSMLLDVQSGACSGATCRMRLEQ